MPNVKGKACARLRQKNGRTPECMRPADFVEDIRVVCREFGDDDFGPLHVIQNLFDDGATVFNLIGTLTLQANSFASISYAVFCFNIKAFVESHNYKDQVRD